MLEKCGRDKTKRPGREHVLTDAGALHYKCAFHPSIIHNNKETEHPVRCSCHEQFIQSCLSSESIAKKEETGLSKGIF